MRIKLLNLDLSIVIPVDLHRRSWDIYKRIKAFVNHFSGSGINIILGCNNQPTFWIKLVQNLIQPHTNFKLCLVEAEACSLAKLRNTALASVQTKFVLFLDIDIYPDLSTIELAYKKALNNPIHLEMFPCLYLSQKGSKKINSWRINKFIDSYYDFRRDLIQHLAFPSSIILTDLYSVQEIQGFDETYIGHGYEDFDFMLRLFKHKSLIKYTQDILIDEPYLAPLMSVGLRAVLIKPFLENLLIPYYFVHVFHKKDKTEDYYQKREINKKIFHAKFKEFNLTNDKTEKLELLQTFFSLLITEKESPKYAVLWAEIEGFKFRS